MQLSLIAALANNRVIGHNNQLPWHIPNDLKRFKKITLNKTIIMGRKTYESIGKPLPNRENIILTRNPNFQAPGVKIYKDLDTALTPYQHTNQEIIVIGGANLYEQAIVPCQTMYLTLIQADFPGDTFFPKWDITQWEIDSEESYLEPPIPYKFITLNKRTLS